MNNRRVKILYQKYVPLTLFVRVRKGCVGFYCERELEIEQKLQYFDPHSYGRQCCVFLVLQMLNRRPNGPAHCWMMAFFTASYLQLLWSPNSIGIPSPFGLVWLSLPHLVYNSVCNCNWNSDFCLDWVQRPLSHLLDLWNRMFDRHQAEITVMQFPGHSLPVHQSMSVPWEFFTSSHFVSQFPPTRFSLITAIRMCHLLPVHHLGMAFLAESKVKIQHRWYRKQLIISACYATDLLVWLRAWP